MTDVWREVLRPERAGVAVGVGRELVGRLRSREAVRAAAATAAWQTGFLRSVDWLPYGLAQGDAGLALMCGYVDACFSGEGWDVVGHEYLRVAAQAAESAVPVPAGLFGGLSGLGFASLSLSRFGTRYQTLLRTIDDAVVSEAMQLAALSGRPGSGMGVGEFDLISGLSGVGAYLLSRLPAAGAAVAGLRAVLDGLVAMILSPQEGPPRWHTPPHLLVDETMLQLYPEGCLNFGLAHGIPGPLALMALSLMTGIQVPGLRDAMEAAARCLVDHRVNDSWGVNWPSAVPLSGGAPGRGEPSRTAWCYGTPGVARSLWLAGVALGQSALCELAIEGMDAVYRRPVWERGIDSPTFCHGVAGLLQITLRFAHDSGHPRFIEAARTLTEQLLTLYEPRTVLGYRDLEPGGRRLDQPGLLTGSAGIALVLLAAATGVEPLWDRVFLLA